MCCFCSPPNQIAPYGWQGYDSRCYIRKSVIYLVYELYVHWGLVIFIVLTQKYWRCVLWHRCKLLFNMYCQAAIEEHGNTLKTRENWREKSVLTHRKKMLRIQNTVCLQLTHKLPTTSSTYPIHSALPNNNSYRSVVEDMTCTHLEVPMPLCKRPGS